MAHVPLDIRGDGEEIDLDNYDDDDDEGSDGEDVDNLGNDDDDDESDDDNEVEDETVQIFIRTFHNGDYDTKIEDALSSDRCTFAARPTQASYNKPANWVERNRIGLEKVIQQLLTCINSVTRDNSFNLYLNHISIGRNQPLVNNEEPIVWHEPIVDRYWDVLEAEIDRRKQLDNVTTDISSIEIENIEMKEERLAALVAIFRSGKATNSSTEIIFDNVNLCGKGIVYLSKMIEISLELRQFRLHHNRMDNMESADCLSRSLRSHTRINTLVLAHCDLGSSPEILLVILQSDVKSIDLRNNNIDSLGAVQIAEYLESNPPIHRIDLYDNRLNDDDAILISQALKRNTNLTAIDMHWNNITFVGVKALLTCVFDSSSLNAISESNHTLEDMNFFFWDNELTCCMDRLLCIDQTEKILLALQDKDSLLQYLANVPVDLIPDVLAFFHGRQADDQPLHKHLNLVYSTMRWWNMPMLYSYHSCVKSDNTKRKRDN